LRPFLLPVCCNLLQTPVMKKIVSLLSCVIVVNALFAQVEMSANNHNLPVRFTQQVVEIKGEKVIGSPFLFLDWTMGKAITPDKREYEMLFKYDVYSQALHYFDGKDSLEINEPIAEFSLTVKDGPDQVVHSFKKADTYGKSKNKGYYEIVAENTTGILLKYYTMKIIALNYNLGGAAGNKTFDLSCTYWWYSKKDKKLADLRNDFKNILQYNKVTASQQEAIIGLALNYERETDALALMKEMDKQ
jgi:hypothetical protein